MLSGVTRGQILTFLYLYRNQNRFPGCVIVCRWAYLFVAEVASHLAYHQSQTKVLKLSHFSTLHADVPKY